MKESSSTLDAAVEQIAERLDLSWLSQGRILIVGLGGIGSILSRYLVLLLAGLPDRFRVVLCDGDAFDFGNTYRMDVPDFSNKADAVTDELQDRFGRPGLSLRSIPEFLTAENAERIIQEGDVVFLCLDNHASRKLASDRFSQIDNGVLISGGNDGVEEGARGTAGNVQVYVRKDGCDVAGAPLDKFHPEIAHPTDRNPEEVDCMEIFALGVPQLLPVNLTAAAMMLSALLRLLMPVEGERMYDEVCFDVLDAKSVPLWLTGSQSLNSQNNSA